MGTEVAWMPIVASVAGSLVSSMIAGGGAKKQEAAPAVQPVTPAPQASKAPDVNALQRNNASMASTQGPDSTLLTGLGGVDPKTLNLGKNTLLGA